MSIQNHRDLIRKSLRFSILDGLCSASMIGFGESFFPVFAVFLMASNIEMALLTSVPLLLGSLVQLYSHKLLRVLRSRKKLVSNMALWQGLMYIPIAMVFFFGTYKMTFLIIIACIYWILGMILSPAWNSWMGDLVSEKERGAYFGKRNMISGTASFFSYLTAGYILHLYPSGHVSEYIGFVTIFLLALCARMVSYRFLTRKYEPEYQVLPESDFTFRDFIREAWSRNYGRFVLYLSFMNFSVYMAAPFFVPYMLRELQLDYLLFTIVNATALVTKFISMPVWGKASDQFGTKKVLALTGFLMPCIPLLWIISGNIYYLVGIQMYAGFVWAGFELSAFNFVFDTTSPEKRVTSVAYYNVLNGVCIFAGAMAGGFIVKHYDIFPSRYFLVFILSALLRYAASFVFIPKLKEVRIVEHIPYTKLFFKIIRTMPTSGTVFSFIPFRKNDSV